MVKGLLIAKGAALLASAAMLVSCGGNSEADTGAQGEPAVTAEILDRSITDEMPAYETARSGGPRLSEEGGETGEERTEAEESTAEENDDGGE